MSCITHSDKLILDSELKKLSYIANFLNTCVTKTYIFPLLKDINCSIKEIKLTIEELKEVPFYRAEKCPYTFEQLNCKVNELLKFLYKVLDETRNITPDQLKTDTDELNKYFLRALLYLQDGKYCEALRSLNIYDSYGDNIFRSYPHLFYYRGLAYYGRHDYEKAEADWLKYKTAVPEDELVHFHLGNVFLLKGQMLEALSEYIAALEIKQDLVEVMMNAEIINKVISSRNKKIVIEQSQIRKLTSTIVFEPDFDIWDIPIFINNFNRLGCLRKLIDWLLDAGYHNIYILDNNSTYQPLLEYYRILDEDDSICVVHFDKNLGHKALWLSGILEMLKIKGPYVYTDSDVLPADCCAKNVLHYLLDILRKYPFLKKVGLGLLVDDITCPESERIKENERRYYMHKMENGLYFGAVDTTFALYRNYRHYNLYVSARTTGNLMAYHLPWYYDYNNLPDDERYYAEHANKSASFITNLKNKKLL